MIKKFSLDNSSIVKKNQRENMDNLLTSKFDNRLIQYTIKDNYTKFEMLQHKCAML